MSKEFLDNFRSEPNASGRTVKVQFNSKLFKKVMPIYLSCISSLLEF